ncbi:MAG TPA: cyclic nucleotide-binding domain-containing protein, partial [Gemmatimonadaceae bacterium]|nr:cyclic nucleotide-binding domain-containing protein [Gemmatimonadaceae bacterium]
MGAVTKAEIVDQLAALPLFAGVPRSELEWMAERGEYRTYAADSVTARTGERMDELLAILSGRFGIYVERGGAKRKIMDAGPGDMGGSMPYSRFTTVAGDVIAEEDATALLIPRDRFPDLTRECPAVTTALVHHMIDRARGYQAARFNDDRLQSLGKLASGLAHELNNPASAAAREAQFLGAFIDDAERAARALAEAGLTQGQLAIVDEVRRACRQPPKARSALEAADREDDIAEWLSTHGVTNVPADGLASCDVSLDDLERVASAVPRPVLGVTIEWIASGIIAREAAKQLASATARIHDLVRAVKGFTFMDREALPDSVDVSRGLADTVAVLADKARSRSVHVVVETAP